MTTFDDGPAKGYCLSLKRAAQFLRVTKDDLGKVDALDQPEDVPRSNETLYAYEISQFKGMCHTNRGRNGGGFFAIASYHIVRDQPTDKIMRSLKLWGEWCEALKSAQKTLLIFR